MYTVHHLKPLVKKAKARQIVEEGRIDVSLSRFFMSPRTIAVARAEEAASNLNALEMKDSL